jgi:hypothetical protein
VRSDARRERHGTRAADRARSRRRSFDRGARTASAASRVTALEAGRHQPLPCPASAARRPRSAAAAPRRWPRSACPGAHARSPAAPARHRARRDLHERRHPRSRRRRGRRSRFRSRRNDSRDPPAASCRAIQSREVGFRKVGLAGQAARRTGTRGRLEDEACRNDPASPPAAARGGSQSASGGGMSPPGVPDRRPSISGGQRIDALARDAAWGGTIAVARTRRPPRRSGVWRGEMS